jgi:hypothetical protein
MYTYTHKEERTAVSFFCFDTPSHYRADSFLPIFDYQMMCDASYKLPNDRWSMIASEGSKKKKKVML